MLSFTPFGLNESEKSETDKIANFLTKKFYRYYPKWEGTEFKVRLPLISGAYVVLSIVGSSFGQLQIQLYTNEFTIPLWRKNYTSYEDFVSDFALIKDEIQKQYEMIIEDAESNYSQMKKYLKML